MKTATCRDCGEPIIWAVTASGKKRPVDAQPSPEGTIYLDGSAYAPRIVVPDEPAEGLRSAHFDTCAKRDREPLSDSWAVAFDLETGGRIPGASVITWIGAVAVDRELNEVEVFEQRTYLRSVEYTVEYSEPEALALQGFDAAVWEAEGVENLAAIGALRDFLARHRHVEKVSRDTGGRYAVSRGLGWNVSAFDEPSLRDLHEFYDAFLLLGQGTMDVMHWVQAAFEWIGAGKPPRDYRLSTVARHLGIAVPEALHSPLVDIRMTLEILRRVRRRLGRVG